MTVNLEVKMMASDVEEVVALHPVHYRNERLTP
jgi:hypothetical protein